MPELDAVGEAATGALVGGTAEPRTGELDSGHTHEKNCLNCRAELVGDYCHACGQRAHVHRTLGAFWHDLLHGVLHFEGKIWRTLPLLAWRPGELTRRYIDGQRARFVSPVALFLFAVFAMFAVFSLVGGPFVFDGESSPQSQEEIQREYVEARDESVREIAELRTQRDELARQGQPTSEVDGQIAELRRGMEIQATVFESLGAAAAAEDSATAGGTQSENDGSSFVVVGGADTLNSWFNDAYRKARKNPQLLLYKLQTAAYKFSWLLIPISVPFVWLLFLHRRRYRRDFKAYDHTVFVTYSISFMTLGVILLSLMRPFGLPEWVAVSAMTFIPPVHMYRQLKGAYGLSRFSALWRTVALLILTALTVTIFGLIMLLMGMLG